MRKFESYSTIKTRSNKDEIFKELNKFPRITNTGRFIYMNSINHRPFLYITFSQQFFTFTTLVTVVQEVYTLDGRS